MLGDAVTVLLTLLKLPGDTSEFKDIPVSTQSELSPPVRNMIHLVHIYCLFITYSAFCLVMKHKSTSWPLPWIYSS